jgi:hypothetical protein
MGAAGGFGLTRHRDFGQALRNLSKLIGGTSAEYGPAAGCSSLAAAAAGYITLGGGRGRGGGPPNVGKARETFASRQLSSGQRTE